MTHKSLPKTYLLSYLALVVANLIWAAASPIIKLTLEFIPPYTFLFFRLLIVCVLILPFALVELAKTKVDKKDYFKIFILGIFSQSSLILIFLGLEYTTAIDSAIIGSLGVLLSMAAGHYFFNEKMSTGVKIGVVLALAGTMVVIFEPLLSNGAVSQIPVGLRIWGNVLVFLNNVAFLLYIIWSKISFGERPTMIRKALSFLHLKPMKAKYPSSLLMSISFFVGMFTMIPFAILENLNVFGHVEYDLSALNPKAVFGLIYMAVLSSIAAYYLFEWALNTVTVGDTAVLGYLSAVFAIPFAYVILREIPTIYNVIGAGVIATGILIAEFGKHVNKRQ